MKALHPSDTHYTNQDLVNELENLRLFVMAAVGESVPTGRSASIAVHEIDRMLANLLAPQQYDLLKDATDLTRWP